MANILFVTWDGGGNVPPAIHIARELVARGHSVRFMGHAAQAETLARFGFELVVGPETGAFDGAAKRHSVLEMLAMLGDAKMGRDVVAEARRHPTDLVVVDCLLFGVMHAVCEAGLRYALLEHFYDGFYRRALGGPIGLAMRLAGRAPRRAVERAAVRVVTSLPTLDPVADPHGNLRQVGPVVEVAPVARSERPTILVSTSTFDHGGLAKALRALVEATRGLDARVVVTAGPVVDPDELPAIAGVEVYRYVPHVELMPQAQLFIGHGGHGSTMQALAHDLPQIIMPMSGLSDQPLVGRSLVDAGAARMVTRWTRPTKLAPLVAELFGDGPHRAAAARLGGEIRQLSGALGGADAVEEALAMPSAPTRGHGQGIASLAAACAVLWAAGGCSPAPDAGGVAATAGAGGGGGASGSSASAGGSSEVPRIDDALTEETCPAGSTPPGPNVAAGPDLHKVTLNDPAAVCNDGSPAVMFVRAAAGPAASSSWVIFLQSGGDCSSYSECRNRWCSYQTGYDAGKMSSRFVPDTMNASGIFGRSANNAFGPANQVFVYYCSSDSWIGQHQDTVFDDPDGELPYRLHFNGYAIVQAVVAALESGVTSDDGAETLPKLTAATQILFSGSSAGATGMTHTLDWWAARYPTAKKGGFLDSITDPLPEDITDPTVAQTFASAQAKHYVDRHQGVWRSHLDESCLAAHEGTPDEHLCALHSHVRLNHLTTPFFVRQDLRDPVQFNSYLNMTGLTLNGQAEAIQRTMERYRDVQDDAEEDVGVAAGIHVSNCGQHIALINPVWFGVANSGNHTVTDDDGVDTTIHDALDAWAMGQGVPAIDVEPAALSSCPNTTGEQ